MEIPLDTEKVVYELSYVPIGARSAQSELTLLHILEYGLGSC
jgi:hypothetical protein